MSLTAAPKIIFFDVDETLYSNHSPRGPHVPESTRQALHELHQKGILTAIATGRSAAVLPLAVKTLITECGIDMLVSINGQYIEYRGQKLADFPMDAMQAAQLSQRLRQHHIAHAFVAHDGLYSAYEDEHLHAALNALGIPHTHRPDACRQQAVYQFLCFYPESRDELAGSLQPDTMKIIRWHPSGTDWLDKTASKARGIQTALQKLGLKMEFKSMGFDALIPAVQSGDIDMIAAGINATPEREKALDFSDVYFDQGGFITVVRKDNTTIHNMDELAGKTVGAQIGTIPVEMAQKIPGTTVKQIDSNANIFMELKAGTIDGAIIDNAVAMYYLKQGADQDLKLVGEPTKAEGTVLGVKKGNKALQEAVNKALKELKEDGTYQKIYDKWFGDYNKK